MRCMGVSKTLVEPAGQLGDRPDNTARVGGRTAGPRPEVEQRTVTHLFVAGVPASGSLSAHVLRSCER